MNFALYLCGSSWLLPIYARYFVSTPKTFPRLSQAFSQDFSGRLFVILTANQPTHLYLVQLEFCSLISPCDLI